MTQQQMQEQQHTGARTDGDSEPPTPTGIRTLSVDGWPPPQLADLLDHDQQVRVECLQTARDLVLEVPADGGCRVEVLDLITVAQYIATGQDPFTVPPLRSAS